MNEELENQFSPVVTNQQNSLVEIEKSRAVQEVQAALVIAKKFPRDEHAAYTRIMSACKRKMLADQAIYKLPISGKLQEGPSIRLAEVCLQAWGNLECGVEEERGFGKSKCIAFCWDKETNTRANIKFEVEHWIEVGQKGNKTKKAITDPNEISRLVANHASKKLRDCIFKMIPGDVVEAAMSACRETIRKGDGKPLADRIRDMIVAFDALGVSKEMIEERIGHDSTLITIDEAVELSQIHNSIRDGQAKRNAFFKFKDDEEDDDAGKQSVIDKLKGKKPEAPKEAK